MKLRKTDDSYWIGFYGGYYVELTHDGCDRWTLKCFEHESDWRSVFGCHAATRREVVECAKHWVFHNSGWEDHYKGVPYYVSKVKNGWKARSTATRDISDRYLKNVMLALKKEIRDAQG